MESDKKMSYKRILVVNLGGIGDLLLSTPALRALRSNYPGSKLFLLVIPRCKEMAESLEYIDGIFYFYKGIFSGNLFRNIQTISFLRKQNFDLLINMRTLVSRKSALMMQFLIKMINPKKTAGRNTEGRGEFLDFKVFESDKGDCYEMEYDLETVRQVGAVITDKSLIFKIPDVARKKMESVLFEEKVGKDEILIGINPGGELSHRWSKDNFAAVTKIISENFSCRFFVTGSLKEYPLAEEIAVLSKIKMINLCGKTDISELGAWLEKASLYITNDTGPMHIAAVLKTSLVAIFGPGYLKRFDPRVISEKALVVYNQIHCAPCNRKICSSGGCLKSISVEEVSKLCFSLLKGQR